MPEQEQDELETTQVEAPEGETTEPAGEASGEGEGDPRFAGVKEEIIATDAITGETKPLSEVVAEGIADLQADPIAQAQHACETRQPSIEELRLARCAEILKRDQKLPTVRQLAMESLNRMRCLKGRPDTELDDALVAVSTKTGVTSVMQRLVEDAAVYCQKRSLAFSCFDDSHLGDIVQGIDREFLDKNGVPIALQALVVDLLRCQLGPESE